ncbi:MAG: hypothetical protein HY235_23380 [Acidobacteria bacterium]|nr:hypothetical protein [Acidobacteriota bacterium]
MSKECEWNGREGRFVFRKATPAAGREAEKSGIEGAMLRVLARRPELREQMLRLVEEEERGVRK